MSPPRIWRKGESVRLTYGGRTVAAHVALASQNGYSLGLRFEALLGGYVGAMPVLWNDATECFECLILQRRAVLKQERPEPEVSPP